MQNDLATTRVLLPLRGTIHYKFLYLRRKEYRVPEEVNQSIGTQKVARPNESWHAHQTGGVRVRLNQRWPRATVGTAVQSKDAARRNKPYKNNDGDVLKRCYKDLFFTP